MNERGSRKIPVTERRFSGSKTTVGEVTLHVGPTMVSPPPLLTASSWTTAPLASEDVPGRPQMMIEVGDHQYAVPFYKPATETTMAQWPFPAPAAMRRGPPRNGTRAMIPGPCTSGYVPASAARCAMRMSCRRAKVPGGQGHGPADPSAPLRCRDGSFAAITRATAEAL